MKTGPAAPPAVQVRAQPRYLEKESRPEASLYVYAYDIILENKGSERVQLLSRHWLIRDGFNQLEEVIGAGVIGQQPILNPGESFRYSSFCPLKTPTGSMEGSYQMKNLISGDLFEVPIPRFELKSLFLMN